MEELRCLYPVVSLPVNLVVCRSILYDLNRTTPLLTGPLEDGGSGGHGLALALPELYFMCILPVYCCVVVLASLGRCLHQSLKE